MPRTLVINDPRPRTRSVSIETSPDRYDIRITREKVEEDADGNIFSRTTTRTLYQTVTFDAETGAPICDPRILALLVPLQTLCDELDEEQQALEDAATARQLAEQQARLKAQQDALAAQLAALTPAT